MRRGDDEAGQASEDRDETIRQRERDRLARDLHDSIGQLLPLAQLKLAQLVETPADLLPDVVEEIQALLARVEQRVGTLAARRRAVSLGGTRDPHGLPLPEATREFAAELREDYGVEAIVIEEASIEPLDDESRRVLYQGVRELLINVARHARVDQAKVRFGRRSEEAWLRVEDEGAGFDPENISFGLRSVAESLQRVGGWMDTDSAPGGGARIRLSVPSRETAPGVRSPVRSGD